MKVVMNVCARCQCGGSFKARGDGYTTNYCPCICVIGEGVSEVPNDCPLITEHAVCQEEPDE